MCEKLADEILKENEENHESKHQSIIPDDLDVTILSESILPAHVISVEIIGDQNLDLFNEVVPNL